MIEIASMIAFGLIGLAALGVLYRILKGPTLADRVVALDMLTLLGVAAIAIFAMRTAVWSLTDVAVALCLVSFLSTCAFARYLLSRP